MKKLLLIVSLIFFWGCSYDYTPQSMFESGKHPNQFRLEGNYSHESGGYINKKIEYVPQSVRKDSIEITEPKKEYVPQSKRKVDLPLITNFNFLGSWIGLDPETQEKIKITLRKNNKGVFSDSKRGNWDIIWFHNENRICVGLDYIEYYSYEENYPTFKDEDWEDCYIYQWINNNKIKIIDEVSPSPSNVIYDKQIEHELKPIDYIPQASKGHEYTPQTQIKHTKKNKVNSRAPSYVPQTIK